MSKPSRWLLPMSALVLVVGCAAENVVLFKASESSGGQAEDPGRGSEAQAGQTPDANVDTDSAVDEAQGGTDSATEGSRPDADPPSTGGAAGLTGSGGSPPEEETGGSPPEDPSGGSPPEHGSGGSRPEEECTSNSDCPPSWLCLKEDCSAERGRCEARGAVCDHDELRPVCGCDGVTYWNECRWRQLGTGSYAEGECRSGAKACNTLDDCGMYGAFCARFLFSNDSCRDIESGSPLPPGVCWVIPPMCGRDDSMEWTACVSGWERPSPDQVYCVDTCLAIWSEMPHRQVLPDDQCVPFDGDPRPGGPFPDGEPPDAG